ncbi:MAG: F0F1 ATP synthase subunit B [Tessaracoccus sp.]
MVPTVGVLQETFLGPLAPHHLSEVIVGILLMLVIFLIMWKVVVPAFEKMYEERSSKIEGGMQRAAVAEAKAEAMLAEYNDQMAAAREEAARIREDAKNQGAQILAEARETASKEADRILLAGRQQLVAERAQLMLDLQGEIGGMATTLASKIVGESLENDERALRTVDRFLEELESAGPNR